MTFRTWRRDSTRTVYICSEAEDLGCAWLCRARPNFLRRVLEDGRKRDEGDDDLGMGGGEGDEGDVVGGGGTVGDIGVGEEDAPRDEERVWDDAARRSVELAGARAAEAASGVVAEVVVGGGAGGEDEDEEEEGGRKKPDSWTLFVLEGEHTCISRENRGFSSASSHQWLDSIVERFLLVTMSTTPKDLQDLILVQFSQDIGYKRAQECRVHILNDKIEDQRRSFQQLPAYCDCLRRTLPGSTVFLLIDTHRRSRRIFVCPAVLNKTFRLCRRLIAADGNLSQEPIYSHPSPGGHN